MSQVRPRVGHGGEVFQMGGTACVELGDKGGSFGKLTAEDTQTAQG